MGDLAIELIVLETPTPTAKKKTLADIVPLELPPGVLCQRSLPETLP